MSTVPSDLYWLRRALANSAKAYNLAEDKLVLLKRAYVKAKRTLVSEIAALYKSSAEDGKLVAGAVNRLQPDGELTRKEALLKQIDRELDRIAALEVDILGETLADAYTDSYYHSVFDVQQAIGVGAVVPRLAVEAVEQAIGTAWSGASYSDRVWKRRDQLARKAEEIITQGVALGHSNDKMARKLSGAMDASYSRASALVRTETNYVYNQGALKGYTAAGVQQYEFVATLDMRTSDQCREHDGKRYPVAEAQAGSNYPPLHVNCRSTVIPVMDDGAVGTRIARSPDGDTYDVPGDMTYNDWYQQHVVGKYGSEQADIYRRQIRNAAADRRQLDRFADVIGDDAPATLEDFQRLKYSDSGGWARMQRQVGTFRKIERMDGSGEYKERLRTTYRTFAAEGHEVRVHALNRMNGQRAGKDRVPYGEQDVLRLLRDPPNYSQPDRLIRYREGIAIVSAADTNEIISVVTRPAASANWKGV